MNVNRAITGWFFVGLDLGQSRDFTALPVLERVPLGTPSTEVVERGKRATRVPELDGWCHLEVDATIPPAIITGGAAESLNNGPYGVPKRDLITGLHQLLQTRFLPIFTLIAGEWCCCWLAWFPPPLLHVMMAKMGLSSKG